MIDKIDRFTKRLSGLKLNCCFNPYSDRCDVFDVDDAPQIRLANLSIILRSLSKAPEIDIWIGRDLGHRGGRRTGLALTDELSLRMYANHLGIAQLPRATKGPPVKEQTAFNISKAMMAADVPVLTWNVFPLHPHQSKRPFSNRQHTRAEARVGIAFLQELCEAFSVRRLIAIGNHAAVSVAQVEVEKCSVRHPSYGGQAMFLSGMGKIYGNGINAKLQPDLL